MRACTACHFLDKKTDVVDEILVFLALFSARGGGPPISLLADVAPRSWVFVHVLEAGTFS